MVWKSWDTRIRPSSAANASTSESWTPSSRAVCALKKIHPWLTANGAAHHCPSQIVVRLKKNLHSPGSETPGARSSRACKSGLEGLPGAPTRPTAPGVAPGRRQPGPGDPDRRRWPRKPAPKSLRRNPRGYSRVSFPPEKRTRLSRADHAHSYPALRSPGLMCGGWNRKSRRLGQAESISYRLTRK